MRQITILGATGSIGQSALDIIERHPDLFSPYALAANTSHRKMAELCRRYRPRFAVMGDPDSAARLEAELDSPVQVMAGEEALQSIASSAEVDTVIAGIVGAAGLLPTMAAVHAGKRILLANKESLVMAGELFMHAVEANAAELLPVDSEHNAIFQCLPPGCVGGRAAATGLNKIILTGSGGPFRDLDLSRLEAVTPEQACAHPNWDMGPKISVDSATMMNKGFEMIEACWLFGVDQTDVEIMLHRQSIVHSMVAYADGSVLAQMGNPDMRTPLANALAWPDRIESGVEPLDLLAVSRLDFGAADEARYPCLALARDAWHRGGTAPATLNAANEVAVDLFLQGRIKFTGIASLIGKVMQDTATKAADNLDTILSADQAARALALDLVA